MDEILLKESFKKICTSEPNTYPENSPVDLFNVTEKEFKAMGYKYKKKKRKRYKGYFLEVFDNDISLFRFVKGVYPNISNFGRKICDDKLLTEYFLKKNNIKTPNTQIFNEKEYKKALDYVKSNNDNYVIKPANLMMALGVYLDVTSENFTKSWNQSMDTQKKYLKSSPKILLQNQVTGLEIRVIVIEGKVASATMRGPAFIIGDGESTIEQLINKRNSERQKNPFLRKNLIKFNNDLNYNLDYRDKSLNTVLDNDEYFILYKRTGIANGRDMFEVTNLINPNILEQAYQATLAIPGIHTSGVDIIIDSLDADQGTVIEVNKRPAFQLSYYPEYGTTQRPLRYIFHTHLLEKKLLNGNLNAEELNTEEKEMLETKFNFLSDKNKVLENIMIFENNFKQESTQNELEFSLSRYKYLYNKNKFLEEYIENEFSI